MPASCPTLALQSPCRLFFAIGLRPNQLVLLSRRLGYLACGTKGPQAATCNLRSYRATTKAFHHVSDRLLSWPLSGLAPISQPYQAFCPIYHCKPIGTPLSHSPLCLISRHKVGTVLKSKNYDSRTRVEKRKQMGSRVSTRASTKMQIWLTNFQSYLYLGANRKNEL